jgi:uncharacterized protein (TIGR00251 family)
MPSARLTIWVQPRASRTELAGLHGDAVKIRLAAPPVDGAANRELTLFLADRLQVSRSAVRIFAGQSSRKKTVLVEGVEQTAAEEKLLS